MASPVSAQRGSHPATGPALSPEEKEAEAKPELRRLCAGRVRAEREEGSGPRERPRRPPDPRPRAPSPEATLQGHPRTRPLSPCKKTSAQRGRGGRAVTHGPLANPPVRPSPERVRGGPAPAATAGVRRPAWRGSLRPAALPGNRVRREGRGVAQPPGSLGGVHTAAAGSVWAGGRCARRTDGPQPVGGVACVTGGRAPWCVRPARGKLGTTEVSCSASCGLPRVAGRRRGGGRGSSPGAPLFPAR